MLRHNNKINQPKRVRVRVRVRVRDKTEYNCFLYLFSRNKRKNPGYEQNLKKFNLFISLVGKNNLFGPLLEYGLRCRFGVLWSK